MKTLLFVTPCLSFAGAEKILCWVAEEFSKCDYSVHILNLNLLDNNSKYSVDGLTNITLHTLKKKYIKGLNNFFRVLELAKLAKAINADCIISFTRYPCVLSVLAGKIACVPTIISERGDPYQYEYGLKNKIDFMILNAATGCVFQTEYAKKAYLKKLATKSIVIPNPVFKKDESRWNKDSDEIVISVGRLDNQQKRYDVMVNAFERFHANYPSYKLHIYGRGLDEDKIIKMVEEKKLVDCIQFKGLSVNPTPLLCQAQIFLITSDFEGVPNALLEAMAVGMPVVSTDCSPGGAKFLINDHRNGLIVPAGNVGAIAKALSDFAGDKDLRIKCGEAAHGVCKRFEPNAVFSLWKGYLETMLQ